jgi:hypothetical protein
MGYLDEYQRSPNVAKNGKIGSGRGMLGWKVKGRKTKPIQNL